MNEFVFLVAEKLKTKGSSLKVDCLENSVNAMWMKKSDGDVVWNGYAKVPQDLFLEYPYLKKMIQDYDGDLNIALQAFTCLYWVNVKSFCHPTIFETDENLLLALAKLEDKIKEEYSNAIQFFQEQVVSYGKKEKQMYITYNSENYQFFASDEMGKGVQQIFTNEIPCLLSDFSNIREFLQKKKDILILKYDQNENCFASTLNHEGLDRAEFYQSVQFLESMQQLDCDILKFVRK